MTNAEYPGATWRPLAAHSPQRFDWIGRFWAKVNKTEGCWLWTAQVIANGYGRFWVNGKGPLAHRVAYELLVGPVPEGLQLDHLCRNRACVNPAHLEPVTSLENQLRGLNCALRTPKSHCPYGHAYTPENTFIYADGVRRRCRTCNRERCRRYGLARKSRVAA